MSAYKADNNAATPRKFARKLAARPTYSAQHRREIERFRPYCFPDSGGLGLRQTLLGIFPRLFRSVSLDRHIHTPHHRPSSQVTLGSAQTRQGTLGSLDSPSAAAPSNDGHLHIQTQAQAATIAALRRRFEQRPLQKRTAAGKRRPPARSPRLLSAAAAARGLRPPARTRRG